MSNQVCMAGRHVRQVAMGLIMLVSSFAANAQSSIEAVTGSVQGGIEVVRIDFSRAPVALPNGFAIQSPARIALDFPGVSNGLGKSSVEVNQGNVRSVSVVQAGDRTRVVLNLKQAAAYKTEIQGKSVLVSLESGATAAPSMSSAAVVADARPVENQPLKDLDFRRGADNAGRVVITLPNSQVGVDIRQTGQTLVVDFLKSTLPEGLRRKLDVGDFGTPVQTITTFQTADRVRMIIEPRGFWEHSAYQSDNQFVVEVRPQRTDPSKLTQGPGYRGEKLSLNFQNIEVRSLLQVIADFTNFNIITSDSVTGSVTLRLKDVPWDQALDIIMQARGLAMRKTDSVIWIAPRDEIAAKEKLELEAANAIQNLEPLRTQSFQLNYTKAADVAAQFQGGGGAGRILSTRGSAISEPRTNQIFVTDTSANLEKVQQLINKLDIAVRQVMIEARVVEATDTWGKSLGVRLGGGILNNNFLGGNRLAFGPNYGDVTGPAPTTASNFVNLPGSGQGFGNAATFAVSLFNAAATRFIALELSALEGDSKGKIVSAPRVVTANQKTATIESGVDIPYQTATSSGATAISFKKATLKLEVTPQITPEGNIILDLEVAKDSRGADAGLGTPTINTKRVKTQVLVDNGGTVVIGGIFELSENDTETRVPVLGDLPVLGNLFKNRERRTDKQEMLVFITPRMITDLSGSR